jgi:hypothetical protein
LRNPAARQSSNWVFDPGFGDHQPTEINSHYEQTPRFWQ